MVGIREIPRTAAFAWSADTASPKIVTGTKANTVDVDFSSETTLELWELDLGDASAATELQPSASVDVDSRYAAMKCSAFRG